MAKGLGVERRGFKDGIHARSERGQLIGTEHDDQLKGTDDGETMDGGAGDDVLIAFAGDDTVIGGDGRDDISGGAGDDRLSGGIWTDAPVEGTEEGDGLVTADELAQDDDSDTFVAASSLEANGTDTILLYDAPETTEGAVAEDSLHDVIDLTDAFVLLAADTNGDTIVDAAEIDAALRAMVTYDAATGALAIDGGTWFNVFADAAGTVAAEGVVVTAEVSTDGGLTTTEMEFLL